jgi:excisionase family DNA binding protein
MNTSEPAKGKTIRHNSKHPRFLKPGDVRRILECSEPTLRRIVQSGAIEHFVIGSQVRFTKRAVDAYLASCHNAKARAKAA